MKDQHYNGYTLSCKRGRFKLEPVMRLLQLTYWAKDRDAKTVKRSIKHSTPFGVFSAEGELVGFMRITSDRSTMFYLADVVVALEERGKGLGLAMVTYALSHPKICRGKGHLMTQTANGLYEKLGFYSLADRLMVRDPVPKQAGTSAPVSAPISAPTAETVLETTPETVLETAPETAVEQLLKRQLKQRPHRWISGQEVCACGKAHDRP